MSNQNLIYIPSEYAKLSSAAFVEFLDSISKVNNVEMRNVKLYGSGAGTMVCVEVLGPCIGWAHDQVVVAFEKMAVDLSIETGSVIGGLINGKPFKVDQSA